MTTDTYTELSPLENDLVDVVEAAKNGGFSVSSTFARTKAHMVAMAASQQLITTRVCSNAYGSLWMPTVAGLKYLSEIELVGESDD